MYKGISMETSYANMSCIAHKMIQKTLSNILTVSVPDPCLLHLVFLFQSERLRGCLRPKHWVLHPFVISMYMYNFFFTNHMTVQWHCEWYTWMRRCIVVYIENTSNELHVHFYTQYSICAVYLGNYTTSVPPNPVIIALLFSQWD